MLKKNIILCITLVFIFVNIFLISNFALAQFGLDNFGNGSDNAFFSANQSIPETVARIINIVIGVIGVLLLVLIVYGGVLYAMSVGNEEQVDKAKKVLTYSIIGIVIVAISFAITNYVIIGLFSDEDEWQSNNQQDTGDGSGADGTGDSQVLLEELLEEGAVLVREGDDMIARGYRMGEDGQAMLDDDDESNDEAGRLLIDDGTELVNGGQARVEEGNRLLNEGRSMRGRNEEGSRSTEDGGSRGTGAADVDVDCRQIDDSCGVLRNFCCSYLECDEAIADSGWPRAFGRCAYGNPECKEREERCLPFGQDCCGGLSCLEGYCID